MSNICTSVISLGGSAIVPNSVDIKFLKEFRNLVIGHIDAGNRLVIICGGGKTSRNYTDAAKQIVQIENNDLDWIGIMSTRLNAELVRSIFSDLAYEKVIYDPTESVSTEKRIIIASGFKPGNSSDLVAVLLAKKFGAREILNISNIEYVCDKDPSKHKDAKKLERISWSDFQKLVGEKWVPGMNLPFDPIATKEASKSKLAVKVLNNNISNLKACLEGKNFKGTTIS